jgi:hypothetical protein
MKRIQSDFEAILLMNKLFSGDYKSQAESDEMYLMLEEYATGVMDLLRECKEDLTPEEILRLARERNKPILL